MTHDFEELFVRYYEPLVRAARRRVASLSPGIGDEADVAQSVLISLFDGIQNGRIIPGNTAELGSLVFLILKRKCNQYLARARAQKRGGGRLRGESALVDPEREPGLDGLNQVVDPAVMPELFEQIESACGDLLERLPKTELKQTALLKLEGYSHGEIADRMQCSAALVKYRVKMIRAAWSQYLASDPSAE